MKEIPFLLLCILGALIVIVSGLASHHRETVRIREAVERAWPPPAAIETTEKEGGQRAKP